MANLCVADVAVSRAVAVVAEQLAQLASAAQSSGLVQLVDEAPDAIITVTRPTSKQRNGTKA